MDALHPEHVQALDDIREQRNRVAHELADLLVNPDLNVDTDILSDLRDVMRALDRFWARIDVQSDPAFDHLDVDRIEVQTGSGALLDYLLDLAGGDDDDTPEPG